MISGYNLPTINKNLLNKSRSYRIVSLAIVKSITDLNPFCPNVNYFLIKKKCWIIKGTFLAAFKLCSHGSMLPEFLRLNKKGCHIWANSYLSRPSLLCGHFLWIEWDGKPLELYDSKPEMLATNFFVLPIKC